MRVTISPNRDNRLRMKCPIFRLLGLSLILALMSPDGSASAYDEVVSGEVDGVLMSYAVVYSQNRRYYARSESLVSFDGSTSPFIEVFDSRSSPDAVKAEKPLWIARVPGWRTLFLGNAGNKIVTVHDPLVRAPSQRRMIRAGRFGQVGVTEVDFQGSGTKKVTRTRIRNVTRFARLQFKGLLYGDAIYPSTRGGTYRWYRRSRAVGDRVQVVGFGGAKSFSLKGKAVVKPSAL